MQGVVVSDLHLFTKRSQPQPVVEKLHRQLPDCDMLVLNGDIFDFRWTILPTIEHTIDKAVRWLVGMMQDFPALELHYVLGNHDCRADFFECLNALSIHRPNFHVHEYYFQTGFAVFLHGDCANYDMTFEQHIAARAPWRECERWPSVYSYPYELCDRLNITELLHRVCFPKPIFARRVVRYLHTLPSGLPPDVRNIYLGHTHLPFQNFKWQNYCLHTTGSAIRGMESSILRFEIARENMENSHEGI